MAISSNVGLGLNECMRARATRGVALPWVVGVAGVAATTLISAAASASTLEGAIFTQAPSVTALNCGEELSNTMAVRTFRVFTGGAQVDTTNPCGGSLHPISLALNVPAPAMPVTFNVDSAILSSTVSDVMSMSGDVPETLLLTDAPVVSYRVEWTWTYQLITGTPGTLDGWFTLGTDESPLATGDLHEGSGVAKGNVVPNSTAASFAMHAQHSQNDADGQWGKAFSHLMVTVTFSEFLLEDLNEDGLIDGADLGLLLGAWDTSDPVADLNGDGVVDGADLGLLLAQWTG
jgi:hypothetical protein